MANKQYLCPNCGTILQKGVKLKSVKNNKLKCQNCGYGATAEEWEKELYTDEKAANRKHQNELAHNKYRRNDKTEESSKTRDNYNKEYEGMEQPHQSAPPQNSEVPKSTIIKKNPFASHDKSNKQNDPESEATLNSKSNSEKCSAESKEGKNTKNKFNIRKVTEEDSTSASVELTDNPLEEIEERSDNFCPDYEDKDNLTTGTYFDMGAADEFPDDNWNDIPEYDDTDISYQDVIDKYNPEDESTDCFDSTNTERGANEVFSENITCTENEYDLDEFNDTTDTADKQNSSSEYSQENELYPESRWKKEDTTSLNYNNKYDEAFYDTEYEDDENTLPIQKLINLLKKRNLHEKLEHNESDFSTNEDGFYDNTPPFEPEKIDRYILELGLKVFGFIIGLFILTNFLIYYFA